MNDYLDERIAFIVSKTVEELQKRGMLRSNSDLQYADACRILEEYYHNGSTENSVTYAIQALRFDPYFRIIPLYFDEKKTLEYIAENLGVDVSTIVRNKKRLCLAIYNEIS